MTFCIILYCLVALGCFCLVPHWGWKGSVCSLLWPILLLGALVFAVIRAFSSDDDNFRLENM